MFAMSSAVVRPTVVAQASAAGSKQKTTKAAAAPRPLLGVLASVPVSIPGVALAFDKEQAESIAKTIEDEEQTILSVFNKAVEAANAAKESLDPVAKEYGAPIARDVSKAAVELNKAAAPVVKKELDIVSRELSKDVDATLKAAGGAIKSSGVDVDPLVGASKQVGSVAKDAVNTAEPTLMKAFNDAVYFAQHLDSAVITAASAVGILAVATAPLWVPGAVKAARGYAGDISAGKTYDEVSNGKAYLVDLRTSKVQERGIPSLPRGNSRLILVEPETILDGTLRARVNDAEKLETQSTALIISSLKKISKSSTVILMGPKAVPVATALTARGFSGVFVMEGGFEKKRGWVDSGLATEPGPSPPEETEVVEAKLLPF